MRVNAAILSVVALTSGMIGCEDRGGMADQPRYEALERSEFFENGTSARPLVPGTVARGELMADEALTTGWSGGVPVERVPLPVTVDFLKRGRERYNIFCSPCHAMDGYGQGMIVQRGYTAPPSLHDERVRLVPDGFLFGVITNGFGRMPPHAQQVPIHDRWAIVAYVRALQLSQHAPAELVPDDFLRDIEGSP